MVVKKKPSLLLIIFIKVLHVCKLAISNIRFPKAITTILLQYYLLLVSPRGGPKHLAKWTKTSPLSVAVAAAPLGGKK